MGNSRSGKAIGDATRTPIATNAYMTAAGGFDGVGCRLMTRPASLVKPGNTASMSSSVPNTTNIYTDIAVQRQTAESTTQRGPMCLSIVVHVPAGVPVEFPGRDEREVNVFDAHCLSRSEKRCTNLIRRCVHMARLVDSSDTSHMSGC